MEGITLEMARAKTGLSQEELAKQLGINRNTYAKYEKYKASMRIDMAQKFSSIVGISIDNLIFLNNNYTSSVEWLHWIYRKEKDLQDKNKKERSIKIGNSKMTFTKNGIKIQSPKVIIKGDVIKKQRKGN